MSIVNISLRFYAYLGLLILIIRRISSILKFALLNQCNAEVVVAAATAALDYSRTTDADDGGYWHTR